MQVAVGSKKTYKVDAARSACELVFPNIKIHVHGVAAESGVSVQPMSNSESITGARNRAVSAIISAPSPCEYAIGIENGLVAVADQWFATTWIVVVNTAGEEGIASTLHRRVPASIMNLVQQGYELTDAIKMLWGSSGGDGLIGLLTRGVLQKQPVLRDGIVTGFAPLLNRQVFDRR